MPALSDGQWQLVYGSTAYTFGSLPVVNRTAPDLGDVPVTVDDQANPREDGIALGVDLFGGRTITFDLNLLGDTEAEVRAMLTALRLAWRADQVRKTPGAVAELHTSTVGRERVVYGRPRRFYPDDSLAPKGLIRAAATFACVDDCWYDPAETAVVVGLVPPPSGGLVAPLVAPLTVTPETVSPGSATVAGDLPAWPIVTFYGPVLNPVCQITNLWTLGLAASIPAGDSVTVDTRPWVRTVLTQAGGSLAGALTSDSVWLKHAAIPPGSYEVALRGTDNTGTASMRLAWHHTYATP